MRILPVVFCLALASLTYAQKSNRIKLKTVHLPNGWSLSPVGRSLPLGDLPLNIAVSSSKKYIAVTNNGQSVQSLQLINPKTERILDNVIVSKLWFGLKFSGDEKFLYASAGNDNQILKYSIVHDKLILRDSLVLGEKWPNKISPAGIEIDDAAQLMYVVTKEDNALYILDLQTKKVISKTPFQGEAYSCLLSNDKKQLYISCWGCDKLLVFDTEKRSVTNEISVGDNPNDICLSKNGKFLFVANANDNSVSVINIKKQRVIETLNTALYPNAPSGSTSNSVALSSDEKTLYIANADNNCLAVFDVSRPGFSKSKGFIPVGWYPTNVKVIGNKIFVANGKGFSSKANPYGPNPLQSKQQVNYQKGDTTRQVEVQYIGGLFKGTLKIIDAPSKKQLSLYSQKVYQNTPYSKNKELIAKGEPGNPVPMKVGDTSPIKHVFYVIKENRTYDQVLGDIKEGNGDPSLVLFGEKITPNQHALAKQFVLLDNLYADGEVSADGHNWSMGAYADDYLEKTWVTSYGGRGGSYDGEGKRAIANNKGGFIWDQCKRAGVTYRTYGEFADDGKANITSLEGHFCPYSEGFNMDVRDTTRFFQWKRDFDSLLSIGQVPQFNSIRFSNDHTEGLRKGKLTPIAHVADNDLAVGMFVEYLSKSPIWKQSAVFIIEDDAQNGADHIDAHRTTGYLAGGFVKRGYTDHTMYSTTSMLRTMELILGIPPMTQYDAAATPLWRSFSSVADTTQFVAKAANVNMDDKNTVLNEWQRRSEGFNLAKEDAAPDLEFNLVLWHAIKGDNVPFPGPRRAAFVKLNDEEKDKD
ncbi:bifunctional YncE family protein/alkaline phosphatase family protein [Segetibacter koreensis]|uniref:bifunctional YncE family protein/alkaline phosphatase family protein n=1 Tax=Segetibacter koreensis TaxID=398037 RepID=UPI00036384A4|nr:bifunctional YncE family protein/alkaline phosphatase family protein [Segetibacter koreensis]